MTSGEPSGRPSYSAFISYSRHDGRFAAWLHRKLESFRFPTFDGRGGSRTKHPLRPTFRDLDELAATADMGDSIRSALEGSNALVLLCSPEAARSQWVNREVEHFIAIGRGDRILPVLVGGDPSHAVQGASATAAFPPALKGLPAEPMWIDFRRGAEPRERGFARIAAGLLGVSFDQIWKRKQRADRARALALAAVAVVVGAPLAYAGYELARPMAMAECPLDAIVYEDVWTKDMRFEPARVGQRLYYNCPESQISWRDYVEEDHLEPDNWCRPYGELVFEGTLNVSMNDPPSQTARFVYRHGMGAPCCWWDAPADAEIEDILADDAFRWFDAASMPRLGEWGFTGVEFNEYSTIENELLVYTNPLTASVCRRDIARDFSARMAGLGAGLSGLFSGGGDETASEDFIE